MKKTLLLLIWMLYGNNVMSKTADRLVDYKTALDSLSQLARSNLPKTFKKAVFITERMFKGDSVIKYDEMNLAFARLSFIAAEWAESNHLKEYNAVDSTEMVLNRAVFQVLKDTIKLQSDDGLITLLPFRYNFDDFDGKKSWENTFVYTLLKTHRGNCHSLPYLYKIIADELGVKCWLALAPNHIYIKNYSKRDGWYNTELTSGDFPIDAWLTTTGYISLTAIQNGLYCDTLSNQQSIALCAIDLAKAYEKETKNYYDGFILQCCDLVLKYHSINPQALLLKAETLKRIYQYEKNANISKTKDTYNEMEALYVHLYDLGYREMPEKMYKDWLQSLQTQRSQYSNGKNKK